MIRPNSQGVFHFAGVSASIVDAGDTGLVAGLVVQNLLNDMRLYTNVGYTRRYRPAQIVETPRRYLAACIQSLFDFKKIIEAPSADTKQPVVGLAARCCFYNRPRHARQRQRVLTSILG